MLFYLNYDLILLKNFIFFNFLILIFLKIIKSYLFKFYLILKIPNLYFYT